MLLYTANFMQVYIMSHVTTLTAAFESYPKRSSIALGPVLDFVPPLGAGALVEVAAGAP